MNFYKHETAICESEAIGENTRLWAFTHVLPGAKIGKECNICDYVFIENDVVLGDRVTVKSGVQIWDGIAIGNDVFIGPNVTFTNDKFPRSKQYLGEYPLTRIGNGASIGANSTILPGLTIGEGSMVGAGSVVTKSVPPFAIVYGNPARTEGYVVSETVESTSNSSVSPDKNIDYLLPGESKILNLTHSSDFRGNLMALDFKDFTQFNIRRIFYVSNVSRNSIRGEHAHKKCSQFLIALSGSLRVILDDGRSRTEVALSSPNQGLFIPPMIWGIQYQFTENAILAVLADESYDEQDYIRNYEEFKSLVP